MVRFSDLTIGSKLILLEVIFLVGFGLFGLVSFNSLNRVKVNGPIYADIIHSKDLIEDILPPPLYIIESYLNTFQMLNAAEKGADEEALKGLFARAKELRKEYEERHAFWMREVPEGQLKQMLLKSYDPAMEFYEARDKEFIPAVLAGDIEKAKTINSAVLQPKYDAHRSVIDKVAALSNKQARRDEKDAAEGIAQTVILLVVIGFGIAAISLLFSAFLSRSITVPLARVAGVARDIAEGKLVTEPLSDIVSRNEIGALAQAFNSMTRQLSDFIDKLRASETKYRIVADNTYDWEFWRSPEGRFLYMSPSCEKITGYKPADFEQDPDLISRLVHPEDRAIFEAHQRETLRGQAGSLLELEVEFRIIAADGTERWISHACGPVYDEAGIYLGKRGSNRDITERKKAEARKQAEEELRVYGDRLEELVRERTAELMDAKELAETASRAKSAFLSSISHELRTPLNAIMGYTEMLKHQENLTATQQQQLEILGANGKHLLTLINNILDVSKIESEKMELEEVAFGLPLLLNQVLNSSNKKAGEKELDFQYEQRTPLPSYVRGDEHKLKQILLNLLDNAIRYTRQGGITLGVSYDRAGGGLFRCDVIDTGIGIPPDRLKAIFEPFTQLVREGQVRDGMGLGLTITERLVRLMRGKLVVESEPGKGSTFRVELPLPSVAGDEVSGESAGKAITGYQGDRKGAEVHEEFVVPPPEEMIELYELARRGDVRKIQAWAGKLEEKDSQFVPFAQRLRALAGEFRTKAIMALVERHKGK